MPTLIMNNLPPVIAATQGNLHQEHQNLQNTKKPTEKSIKQIEIIKTRIKALKYKQQNSKSLAEVLIDDIIKLD